MKKLNKQDIETLKTSFEMNEWGDFLLVLNEVLSENMIIHEGYKYWYEYKLAKDRVDICLATKNPKEYCNGLYLYSAKDPGTGMAFVVLKTDNPEYINQKNIKR